MTKLIDILVVDDEPLAARRLCRMLARIDGLGEIRGAEGGWAALEHIRASAPDILMLDIEMPGLNGFQVLEALPPHCAPAVIFVTAYDEYAVKAFERNAVDYLVKPPSDERLHAAITRACRTLESAEARAALDHLRRRIYELQQQLAEPTDHLQEIWAPDANGAARVPVHAIEWIEAEKDYVRLHLNKGSRLLHRSLASLEADLPADEFRRVHRSAIVRMAAVQSLLRRKYGALALRLNSGACVPVSRSHAPAVRRLFKTRLRSEENRAK